MQQGIPRNFLLHKNSGKFYSCRRFHHILRMCAVFTAASFYLLQFLPLSIESLELFLVRFWLLFSERFWLFLL